MKKFKALLSIFLCIAMMFAMAPMAVWAEDEITVLYDIELQDPHVAADIVIDPMQAAIGDTVTVTVTPHEGYGLKSVMHSTPQWWGGIVMNDNGDGSYTGSFVFDYGFNLIMVGVDQYRTLNIVKPADAEVTLISRNTGMPVTNTAMEWEGIEITISGPAIGYTASYTNMNNNITNEIKLTNNSGMFNMPEADATLTITALETYIYTEGANSTWEEEEDGSASFKIEADISKHVAVYVDETLVDPANYTVTEGSTIITFKPEFLATLADGQHELTVAFTDGLAITNFTVETADETPTITVPSYDDYEEEEDEEEEDDNRVRKPIVIISRKDQEAAKEEKPVEEENPNTGAI